MLKVMRQSFHQLKWTLWAVVVIFIAFIFVDWGMGRSGGSSTKFNSGEIAGSATNRSAPSISTTSTR